MKPHPPASPPPTPQSEIPSAADRLTQWAHDHAEGNGKPKHVGRIRDLYTRVTYRGIETVVDNSQKRSETAAKAAKEAISEDLANAFLAYAEANKEVQRTGDVLLQILALEL